MVQRLRLPIPNSGGPGSIPEEGPRSHMPQLKISDVATEIKDPERHNEGFLRHN